MQEFMFGHYRLSVDVEATRRLLRSPPGVLDYLRM